MGRVGEGEVGTLHIGCSQIPSSKTEEIEGKEELTNTQTDMNQSEPL